MIYVEIVFRVTKTKRGKVSEENEGIVPTGNWTVEIFRGSIKSFTQERR